MAWIGEISHFQVEMTRLDLGFRSYRGVDDLH